MLSSADVPLEPILDFVAGQVQVDVTAWNRYGLRREQTRREHLAELQAVYGFRAFTGAHYRSCDKLALQTDKGIVLAIALVQMLRGQAILLPSINVIERACAQAITRGSRRI